MKRNFLLTLAGAFAVALLANANAFAACPAGVSGTQLNANYAIKVQGAVTDTGACLPSSCSDPTPQAIDGVGILHFDGACDIDKGEFIYSVQGGTGGINGGGVTAPTTINIGFGLIGAFTGTMTAGLDHGTYGFNSNNQGTMTLIDGPSGKVFVFGITAELGSSEFRGSRVNSGDPLVIVGEKQANTITQSQILTQAAASFDAGGGGTAGGALGVGFDSVGVELTAHLDPETGTTPEGGGTIFFDVDNGYDSTVVPGLQILPPGGGTLVCDFHSATVIPLSLTDGTSLTDAGLVGDFSCPLAPSHFENASVYWGSTNSSAFLITTGTNGVTAGSAATGTLVRAIAPGAGAGGVAVIAESNANLHPSATITLKNNSVEPIDYTALALVSVPDVQIQLNSSCTAAGTPYGCCTGAGAGTCGTCPAAGDIPADNVLFGPGSCTVVVQGQGNQCTSTGNSSCTAAGHPYTCCTGSGTGSCVTETGSLQIQNNDHTFAGATQTGAGANFLVKCL